MKFLNSRIKKQAIFLTREFKDINQSLDVFNGFINNIDNDIFNAYSEIKNNIIKSMLMDMEIDLINNKEGIRVELLKNAGIKRVADLMACSFDDLNNIHGIGAGSSLLIIKNRDFIIHKASQMSNFKFPEYYDQKYSSLWRSIFYKLHESDFKNDLEYFNNLEIKSGLNYLSINNSYIKYFFSVNKVEADESFNYFNVLYDDNFIDKINLISDKFHKLINIKDEEIYSHFQQNVADYYSIIDKYNEYIPSLNSTLADKINHIYLNQDGLNTTLRNYQVFGCKFILNEANVFLGDEMGLGKTIQAIGVINHLMKESKNNILIIVPLAVLTNWCKEIEKALNSEINIIYGNNLTYKENMINITTFETLNKINVETSLDICIVDEAHFIKNKQSKRSINTVNILKKSRKIVLMSGTPLENNLDEFLFLISLLDKKVAKELSEFANLLKTDIFKDKIAHLYLRRKREDVLKELPSLVEKKEWCTLNEEEFLLYEKSLESRNFMQVRRVSFDAINSSKVNRIRELVENIKEENRKVIIFSYFLDTLDRLYKELQKDCVGILRGKLNVSERDKILHEFKEGDKTVLLSQIQSGGIGLNIQSASVVIICEPQLKPSIEKQAISRVYRMGQNKTVFIHRILMDDTVDEYVMGILDKKNLIFDEFVDESYLSKNEFAMKFIEEELKNISKKRTL